MITKLIPVFIILSIYSASAQELKIKLTDFNFSSNISKQNKDSLFLFPFLNAEQHSNFQMFKNIPIYKDAKNIGYSENKFYMLPEYNSMDKINNYKYFENKVNQDCIFCGIFEGIIQK